MEDQNYSNHVATSRKIWTRTTATVIACLVGRDAQEVLSTGFVQTPSGNSRWFLSSIIYAMPVFTRAPVTQLFEEFC